MMKKQIGFIQTQEVIKKVVRESASKDKMLTFDSNNAIHFNEATYNTLILGSTGSGKTSSAILPAADSLIKAGFAGLIIDVKGNLSKQIQALAKKYNRENDIVILGSSLNSARVNLLDGMSEKDVYSFFKMLVAQVTTESDHSKHWHEQGIRIAVDAFILLSILKIDKNIIYIKELLNDLDLCVELFDLLEKTSVEKISKKSFKKFEDLKKRVKNDAFHIFKAENDNNAEQYSMQVTWRLSAILNALECFEDSGLADNFSTANTKNVDMSKLIYDQKKIVIVSFAATAGKMAGAISRFLIQNYYKAVLKNGLELKKDEYTFLIADEFQDCFDFESSLSDNYFTSKAREFNSIQLFASQSVSSFMSRGAGAMQVNEFLNNCNNKIFFYSDDDYTQSVVYKFNKKIELSSFNQSECFIVRYNSFLKKHVNMIDSLQISHDKIKQLILSCDTLSSQSHCNGNSRKRKSGLSLQAIVAKKVKTSFNYNPF